jgi:hypothetical protein
MLESLMGTDVTDNAVEGTGSGPVPRSGIITFSLVAATNRSLT